MQDLEERYGFAANLAALSDHALIDRFNAEVGNRGWGNARMYLTNCLAEEIARRDFDSSAIRVTDGLSFRQKCRLTNGRLEILE